MGIAQSRARRSLLPFIGSILSGVSTEKQVNHMKAKIDKLADSQVEIIHAVPESMSIINATHQQVVENWGAIQMLTNATNQIRKNLHILNSSIDHIQTVLELHHFGVRMLDMLG